MKFKVFESNVYIHSKIVPVNQSLNSDLIYFVGIRYKRYSSDLKPIRDTSNTQGPVFNRITKKFFQR